MTAAGPRVPLARVRQALRPAAPARRAPVLVTTLRLQSRTLRHTCEAWSPAAPDWPDPPAGRPRWGPLAAPPRPVCPCALLRGVLPGATPGRSEEHTSEL